MECPVCYENSANCTLVCKHKFCYSCVKTWYMQNGTCPMCRKNLHYKRMPIHKWTTEAEETRKTQIFQKCFDDVVDILVSPIDLGFVTLYKSNVDIDELVDLEKTYRALKSADCTAEEIDYVLNETDEYYSDRMAHLMKRTYAERKHVYPNMKFHRQMKFKNKAR
jgi:hypothetical protein